jgi:hypothetical protein
MPPVSGIRSDVRDMLKYMAAQLHPPPGTVAQAVELEHELRADMDVCRDCASGCSTVHSAQLTGAFAATFLFRWLVPNLQAFSGDVVVPQSDAHTINRL